MTRKTSLFLGCALLVIALILCAGTLSSLTILWESPDSGSLTGQAPTQTAVIRTPNTQRSSPTPPPTASVTSTPNAQRAEKPDLAPQSEPTATASLQPTPSTLDKLLNTAVPTRDLYALTEQLKHADAPVPRVVREEPFPYEIGHEENFWVADLQANTHFPISATLELKTENVYWWIESNAEFDPAGLQRSADAFETQIYPTNRQHFGQEWSPGVDADPRIHVLHASVPGPVAGTFSNADEYPRQVHPFSNQREMVFINLRYLNPGDRAYEAVLAHEFQHMIHWNVDRDEETWVNEGASQIAERLNGYGGASFLQTFTDHPDLQLNDWADQPGGNAPHYGAAFSFLEYYRQRFGTKALRQLVAEPANGTESIDLVLANLGTDLTFQDVFMDWTVANYLDDPSLENGQYGYEDLNVQVAPAGIHDSYPARRTDTVRQHGTDYITLLPGSGDLTIEFQGNAEVKLVPNQPHSGRQQWWSNRGDASNMTLTRSFDLSDLNQATLEVWLWYDIEENWDYAYIEVSTDGGETWKTLPGRYTTTNNPNGNNFGHGYTGRSNEAVAKKSPEWVKEEIDLTWYTGQEVLIRFEYITDAAVNNVGLAIDDIAIPELSYSYDGEEGDGGWVARGFIRNDNSLPQQFSVQLIEIGDHTKVRELPVDTEGRGQWAIQDFDNRLRRAILVITALSPVTTEPAHYEYEITASN